MTRICRQNWLDVQEYVAHVEKRGRSPETVKRVRGFLRHLLLWAGETPFGQAREIDPALPTWLLTSRLDGIDKPLSPVSMRKICQYAQLFFTFMRGEYFSRYRKITPSWVDMIEPSIAHGLHSQYKEHAFYKIEDIRRIAELPVAKLREERDRAAICFLFVSAMRAQAFVSMPIKCVDLGTMTVKQFPELGVRTKNGKAAVTSLLQLRGCMEVVQAWDAKLRANGMTGDDLWFPVVDMRGEFVKREKMNFINRRTDVADGLKSFCKRLGITYLSLHKLRHGHIYFMMNRVKDMKGLKALSQNVMHSSVAITDGIYGRLVIDDIKDVYGAIQEE